MWWLVVWWKALQSTKMCALQAARLQLEAEETARREREAADRRARQERKAAEDAKIEVSPC